MSEYFGGWNFYRFLVVRVFLSLLKYLEEILYSIKNLKKNQENVHLVNLFLI